MRIAFLNRGRDNMPGGDCIGLDATMDALRKRGHTCVETGWDRDAMRSGYFDLAHIQHCNFSWSWGNYEAVRDVGLPYVLVPVYYPGPLLSGITLDNLKGIIRNAKRVLPFSDYEKWEILNAVLPTDYQRFDERKSERDFESLRYSVIPNATDETFWAGDRREHMSVLDVLTVSARGESDKNVGIVKRICERLNRSFTLATGLSREDLADTYKHHRVFVNASGSERMSLTIGEALCAGCRVLATDQNWGNEHYTGLVTFDPNDENCLELLIKWALTSEHWDYRPNSAARCITWDWVAGKLEEVYREVLNG